MEEGSSACEVGTSVAEEGLSEAQKGLSVTEIGSSVTEEGPSDAQAGSSDTGRGSSVMNLRTLREFWQGEDVAIPPRPCDLRPIHGEVSRDAGEAKPRQGQGQMTLLWWGIWAQLTGA